MGQVLYITSESKLTFENNYIVFSNNDKTIKYYVPDITSVVFENQYNSLSIYLLNRLIENNVNIIICDKKHLPYSTVTPNSHYNEELTTEYKLELISFFNKNIKYGKKTYKVSDAIELFFLDIIKSIRTNKNEIKELSLL